MRLISFIFLNLFIISFNSQNMLILDGITLYAQANSSITVQGNVINNNGGEIDNSGNIYVSGDWTNNGGNTLLVNNSPGWVELNGNLQVINGNSTTEFENLKLDGISGSVKTIDINTSVNSTLDLSDNELQTQEYILYSYSTNTNSIIWNGGYVSSGKLGGYLVRATSSDSTYIFPVGSSLLNDTYRAVHITPNSNSNNSYGVRLAAVNPSNDFSGTSASGANGPFNEFILHTDVDIINTYFYHNIYQFSGNAACDISIDYYSSDGLFNSVAQWDDGNVKWEDRNFILNPSSSGAILNNPDNNMTKQNISNFMYDVFALSIKVEEVISEVYIPNVFSPNGDGFNDVFLVRGGSFKSFNFKIFNRWGEQIFSSTDRTIAWDGTFKGKEVSSGVYVYQLIYTNSQGVNKRTSGNITLIQ